MNRLVTFFASAFLTSVAIAQQLPVGRYSGSYQNAAGTQTNIVLDIKSVDDGVVKGVASYNTTSRRGGPCRGDYPVEGTLKEGNLDVRALEKGGSASDCSMRIRAKVDGDALQARYGQSEFTMTK